MGTVIKSTTTRNAVRLVFTIPHFLSSRYFLYCANASLGAKLDAVVLVRELRQRKKKLHRGSLSMVREITVKTVSVQNGVTMERRGTKWGSAPLVHLA